MSCSVFIMFLQFPLDRQKDGSFRKHATLYKTSLPVPEKSYKYNIWILDFVPVSTITLIFILFQRVEANAVALSYLVPGIFIYL